MKQCECEYCKGRRQRDSVRPFGWGYQPKHTGQPTTPPPKKP